MKNITENLHEKLTSGHVTFWIFLEGKLFFFHGEKIVFSFENKSNWL